MHNISTQPTRGCLSECIQRSLSAIVYRHRQHPSQHHCQLPQHFSKLKKNKPICHQEQEFKNSWPRKRVPLKLSLKLVWVSVWKMKESGFDRNRSKFLRSVQIRQRRIVVAIQRQCEFIMVFGSAKKIEI